MKCQMCLTGGGSLATSPLRSLRFVYWEPHPLYWFTFFENLGELYGTTQARCLPERVHSTFSSTSFIEIGMFILAISRLQRNWVLGIYYNYDASRKNPDN